MKKRRVTQKQIDRWTARVQPIARKKIKEFRKHKKVRAVLKEMKEAGLNSFAEGSIFLGIHNADEVEIDSGPIMSDAQFAKVPAINNRSM